MTVSKWCRPELNKEKALDKTSFTLGNLPIYSSCSNNRALLLNSFIILLQSLGDICAQVFSHKLLVVILS